MYNKKGKIDKPVSHTSWRNKGFYFEDYDTPRYENKDQLKRDYIDFRYVILNPKILIGIEEFNQEFFDEIHHSYIRSHRKAIIKSFMCRPPIECVHHSTLTKPHSKTILG